MKKAMTTIAALALAAGVCATGVFAAGRNFRDANNDGICDNRTTLCAQGQCSSWCTGFVDADGDGVCDNRSDATGLCGRQGTGLAAGSHHNAGHGWGGHHHG